MPRSFSEPITAMTETITLVGSEIRKYLADIVETGLLCCLHRLEKDRVKVQEAKLLNDFTKVKQHFLASTPD